MESRLSTFPTTHWTRVHSLRSGSGPEASRALEEICRDYWYPIYAYLRRSGLEKPDAEDATQAFFERLVAGNVLAAARQERGKLRSFMLAVLEQLLVDRRRHASAAKRGGGIPPLSLDVGFAEERYRCEPPQVHNPEELYLLSWARSLLDGARERLRKEFADQGRAEMFQLLESYLVNEESAPPCAELASALGSTPGAVRLVVFRLRKRYRALLEDSVAQTLLDPADLEGEMAWVRMVLNRP